MSGWLAIFRKRGGPIEANIDALRARGPDGHSVVAVDGATLALTVLDTGERVPTARAPIEREDIVVTGVARIDARDEVARELNVSTSISDLELLSHAIAAWGSDVPRRVAGEFSAAAYDKRQRRLLLVRDGFGVRPAYVADVGEWVIASNTIAAIRAHPAVTDALDDDSILEFLLYERVLGPERTAFRDIKLVPPGGALVADRERSTTRKVWSLEAVDVDRRTPLADLALAWRDALDRATSDRLRGAHASIMLSGGIDSTSVAASATAVGGGNLFAVTDIHGSIDDDEGRWAALAARRLGIRHRSFVGDVFRGPIYTTSPLCGPEPIPDVYATHPPGSLPAMAAHGRVVLHGEGGDEIWRESSLRELIEEREPLTALAGGLVASALARRRPAIGLGVLRSLRGQPQEVPRWIAMPIDAAFIRRADELMRPRARGPRRGSLTGLTTALWRSALISLDAEVLERPLEVRLPLLDRRVVHAALRIPPLPGVVQKTAARLALKGRLPETLLRRRKSPAPPWEPWAGAEAPWRALHQNDATFGHFVDLGRLRKQALHNGATSDVLRAIAFWRWLRGIAGA